MIFRAACDIIFCRNTGAEHRVCNFLWTRRDTVGIFKALREKYSLIRFLVEAQKTVWYPVLFAALCTIAGTNNYKMYIPILWVLTAFVLFSALFADDNKVFLTPLLMIFFSLGCDTERDAFLESNGDMLSFMSPKAFPWVIVICAICVSAFVIRLFADGSVAAAFKKRRRMTIGIIAMDIAFLANGILSPTYSARDFGLGAFLAMGFTVVYFLVSGMLENSRDVVKYACVVMLGTAYVAFLQIMTVLLRKHLEGDKFLFIGADGGMLINRTELTLGWGVTTVVAAVFILGIPAAMYLAKNCRFSAFSYVSAVFFLIGAVLINTRASMAVGAVAFVVCVILCLFSKKNRLYICIYSGLLLIFTACALIIIHVKIIPLDSLIRKMIDILRIGGGDSGRSLLWQNGIEDFKSSPVFGIGFNNGAYEDAARRENFYSNMYHCILVQIPASMGIVGGIAFLLHCAELCILCFKKFSANKLLVLLVPLMILALSLVDNFFFYLHFQIFYGALLAVAETMLKEDSAKSSALT